VRYFLQDFARENGRDVPEMSKEAMDVLTEYHWPGNVRELRNVLENTFVFLRGKVVQPENLPNTMTKSKEMPSDGLVFPLGLPLEQVETEYLKRTLAACDGNRTRAAEMLKISRRTLQRRVKELGIEE
jgi:DNA-binding NtrC family response regulator